MRLDQIHAAVTDTESSLNTHYLTIYSLAIGLQSQRVFEFGAGNSSRVLLRAMEITHGRLTSCDIVDPRAAWPPSEYTGTGIDRNWQFLKMTSSQALAHVLNDVFDLVLHDGSHESDEVAEDIAGILPRMKRFGVLLVHDVEQAVLGPQVRRGLMEGIRRTGLSVSMTSLPFSDGLAVIRVESHTGRGEVRTTWCKHSTLPAIPAPLPWRPLA